MRRALGALVAVTAAGAVALAAALVAQPGDTLSSSAGSLALQRVPIGDAVVRDSSGGTRGPASASLHDGRVLLGGGEDGRRLLIVDPATGSTHEVGAVMSEDQRRDDARFAPTDIEVMSTTPTRFRLYVSYPEWVGRRECVRLAVDRVDISREEQPRLLGTDPVFRSEPCVPPGAIQHASGRLVRIDWRRAYVTLGDLGFPGIDDRSRRGQLGSVLRIGDDIEPKQVSQGHRNGQGLAKDRRGLLWETEHGPSGGDELNLIRSGRDYGWPFVTLGEPYGTSDYVMPERTGTHTGYTRPRTSWVPSVATSEVVQVPATWQGWASWRDGDLLMGTLRDQSLWRIRLDIEGRVEQRERLEVGHRIRDMEVRDDNTVVATTDDGTLLVISPRR
jgi:glucose/arabinose dehydrogenase